MYLYSHALLFVCFILYRCNISYFLRSFYLKYSICFYRTCLTAVCFIGFYYCSITIFICLFYMTLSQLLCAIVGGIRPGGTLLSFIYKKLRLLCSYTCNNKNLKNRVILSKREIFKDFCVYITCICLFWLILRIVYYAA